MNDYNTTSDGRKVLDFRRNFAELNALVYGLEYWHDYSENVYRDDAGALVFYCDGVHKVNEQTAREYGTIDFHALRESVSAILNNEVVERTMREGVGYWEQVSGFNPELFREWIADHADEVTVNGYDPDDEDDNEEPDIYTWFLLDEYGAEILMDAGEIVYYNEDLDLYALGVTHFGTPYIGCRTNIYIPEDLTA